MFVAAVLSVCLGVRGPLRGSVLGLGNTRILRYEIRLSWTLLGTFGYFGYAPGITLISTIGTISHCIESLLRLGMLSITEVFVNSPDFLVLLDIAAMDVGYTYIREDSMVRASRCDRFCFQDGCAMQAKTRSPSGEALSSASW
jgi:hypothetical protein